MNNLYHHIQKNISLGSKKASIVFKEQQLDQGTLVSLVNSFSNSMLELGALKGKHVAIFLNNGIEFSVSLLACANLGLVAVPFPLTLKGAQRAKSFEISKIDFVIGWHYTVKDIINQGLVDPACVVTVGAKIDGAHEFEEMIKDGDPNFQVPYTVETNLHYILTMTSGSTGDPKPIVFSQKTKLNRSILGTANYYGLGHEDVILLSTPMYHSLAQRSFLLPLIIGGTCIILEKFTPELWLEAVEKYRVTFMFSVSNQLEMILGELKKGKKKFDLSSLRTIVSSSAVLKDEVKRELLEEFDCDIHECYGTSEVGVVTDYSVNKEFNKLGSVGKALPYVDLVIRSSDGLPVKVGEPGEITCRTLTAFEGYFNNPEATAKAVDKEGFFYTGDLGKVDEDGYLYYLDRLKDVIKTGGISVYSRDVETVIKLDDQVLHCAVIGVQDLKLGEAILAVIVPKDKDKFDLKKVKKICLDNLIDYQMPRAFEIVDSIPSTGLGKIQKGELKKLYCNFTIKNFI